MSNSLPASVKKLIDEFRKLPGIGHKSAARIVYFYLRDSYAKLDSIAELFLEVKDSVRDCTNCYSYTDNSTGICNICSDARREKIKLMVVEQPLDISAIDDAGFYTGQYHVLRGAISPINGVGPEDLTISQLVSRVKELSRNKIPLEIVLATSTNLEGDATSAYLINKLADVQNISISTLGRGLPSGAELDYADAGTISRAFEGRQPA